MTTVRPSGTPSRVAVASRARAGALACEAADTLAHDAATGAWLIARRVITPASGTAPERPVRPRAGWDEGLLQENWAEYLFDCGMLDEDGAISSRDEKRR